MFSFLLNWIDRKSVAVAKREAESFVLNLRAMDSMEIAMALVFATHIRHQLEISPGWNVADPPLCVATFPNSPIRLRKLIHIKQKAGQMNDAAGLMVWLHTLRGAARLELRQSSRDIWRELARGFPYLDEAGEQLFLLTGVKPNLRGATDFPAGSTPEPL